jgi:uncharacterized protein (UPF0333 family)
LPKANKEKAPQKQLADLQKMKKFLIALLMLAGSFSFANAQTKQKTVPKKATVSATAKTTPAVKSKEKKAEKTVSAAHTKADGTPDKRFKENKKSVAAGPMKKDGTPDKRYKANKK